MARTKKKSSNNNSAATVGFEQQLWAAADALRNNMDAAEYKHVVLGLIFLKYISDAFAAKHAELEAQRAEGADPEDPDEYRAAGIFWVLQEARWAHLKSHAPQPAIGKLVDDAMAAIERDNPSLKGVLPKDYARPGLDKERLGQLINLVSDIALGDPAERTKDTLGRVYEYFLSQFASAEGKKGGQFYTPTHVVRVLVEMLAPYQGRVYDPCCGSGGMFVQSEKFIEAHAGRLGDISIYGQESNYTTWRLAKMNLAIRGIDAQIAHGDTFHNHRHPDLKADYVLANPPFNDSDWRGDGGRYPFIQTGDIKNSGGRITKYQQTYNEAGLAQSRMWPIGTMCITIAANIAETGILTFPACFPDSVVGFIPDQSKCDVRFVEYTFRYLRQRIQHEASGSVQDNINLETLNRLRFALPPLSEQRAIAHILGTLDDKIELNRRMSETLEAMARALFKSWFVDFDPVRAKAEGRDPGLPKPLADLFPDSFEDSELGEITKGWEVVTLPDAIEVNPTRSLRKGDVAPYLDMANMPTKGHTPDAVVDRSFGSGMRFINGDTLVARITPCLENGKTAFVDFLAEGQVGWGSTEYIVLRPKPPLPAEFAYCLARSAEFREFAIQSMTGSSGRQRVPAASIAHYVLAMATPDIAVQFGRAVEPLFARGAANARESRTLTALRDALLPKLISGQLRIGARHINPCERMRV